ncbi:MAG: toll/interleukin-1 receptor domain-containing protein, partial [Methylococcales bacterium]
MQVFISHASTDAQLAKRIANVLRESGLKVWDDAQILPGDNWGAKLADALQESDAMVVLLTPNSVGSPNLSYEVGYALGKLDYKGRLIPVIVAPPG